MTLVKGGDHFQEIDVQDREGWVVSSILKDCLMGRKELDAIRRSVCGEVLIDGNPRVIGLQQPGKI